MDSKTMLHCVDGAGAATEAPCRAAGARAERAGLRERRVVQPPAAVAGKPPRRAARPHVAVGVMALLFFSLYTAMVIATANGFAYVPVQAQFHLELSFSFCAAMAIAMANGFASVPPRVQCHLAAD